LEFAPMLLKDGPASIADEFQYPAQRDWQTNAAAQRYGQRRSPAFDRRFHREDAIIGRWLDELPESALVLDAPCGTGRLVEPVTRRGLRYLGVDISSAMIAEATARVDSALVLGFYRADAARLPFKDDSVDCVIVWRLLHHIPDVAVRRAILSEAARVTRRTVLLSFHHPCSLAALRKKLQRQVLRKGNGVEFTARVLTQDAESAGLRLAETQGFHKFVSINWFARLDKT
jgi:ubiquinone/menaquinone biosynthesis C-methylase UbiE